MDPSSLASHIKGHYLAPLAAMDSTWFHHSLISHDKSRHPAPLATMDSMQLHLSLASPDNGHYSTLRNKLHVALNDP